MGSGPRFSFRFIKEQFGFGFFIGKFPFALTINIYAFFWAIGLGFGKGYDER